MNWVVERDQTGEAVAVFADEDDAREFVENLNRRRPWNGRRSSPKSYRCVERSGWDDCPCCGHEPGPGGPDQ